MKVQKILMENPNFEFDSSLKKLWLSTRKRPQRDEHPGIFYTYRFEYDIMGFAFVILLELVGLYFFRLYVTENLIFIVSLFFADILFAFGGHWNQGKIILLKNEIFLMNRNIDTNPVASGRLQLRRSTKKRLLKRLMSYKWIFYSLIFIFGISKGFFFIILYIPPAGATQFNAISFLIFLSYFIVCLLHVNCTGYFIYTTWFNYNVNRQLKKHVNYNQFLANDISFKFEEYFGGPNAPFGDNWTSDTKFNDATIRDHNLKDNNLNVKGILTDLDIAFMNMRQNHNDRILFLHLCRLIQMRVLDQEPIP